MKHILAVYFGVEEHQQRYFDAQDPDLDQKSKEWLAVEEGVLAHDRNDPSLYDRLENFDADLARQMVADHHNGLDPLNFDNSLLQVMEDIPVQLIPGEKVHADDEEKTDDDKSGSETDSDGESDSDPEIDIMLE